MAELACKGGVKWVQLRIKDRSFEDCLAIAIETKKITDAYNAALIINDHVAIAKIVGAHGIHLGKNDMDVAEARQLLGSCVIIGGTANTAHDIRQLHQKGADYIGLGPFRYTVTKKDLSPILGIAGYRQIITDIKSEELDVPLIAIGGINKEDIDDLLGENIYGIAVSSAINCAADIAAEAGSWIKIMNKYNTKNYAKNC